MIEQQTLVVTLENMFTHILKCIYLYATPDAERRGILLIKFIEALELIQNPLKYSLK